MPGSSKSSKSEMQDELRLQVGAALLPERPRSPVDAIVVDEAIEAALVRGAVWGVLDDELLADLREWYGDPARFDELLVEVVSGQ